MTQALAGPFCTMLLADMGAEVIRLEHVDGRTRKLGVAPQGDDGIGFLALNRNKKSVALDLTNPDDQECGRQLAASADVFVENYRPGVVNRLGLGWGELSAANPTLIYASISGFGQSGPYADRPGYDLITQGMTGLMSVTGHPEEDPVKCGVPICDLAAGMLCSNGILTALIARQRNGRGQQLNTSLYEAGLAMSVWESADFWATGEVPQPLGSAHRANAPYQAFRAADGWMTIGANGERHWQACCHVLDRADLIEDPRFSTNELRMKNRAALVSELEDALRGGNVDTWLTLFHEAGVPAGPIRGYDEVFRDEQTVARRMVEEVDHPVEGQMRVLGVPVKLAETPGSVRTPPPLLGEHNVEVLNEFDTCGRD